MRFSETAISLISLKLLLITLLLDIGGGFGLKYAAIVLGVLVSIYKVAAHGVVWRWWPEAVVMGFFLTAGLLSIASGTPVGSVYSEISFLAFFVLVPLLYGIVPAELSRIFLWVVVLGGVMVIVSFLLLFFLPGIARPLADLGMENGLGYLGYRPGFDGVPNVYFRWSVWLVLGLSLALVSRSFLSSVIVSVAAVLTTSTAIIMMLPLVVAGYIAVVERRARGCFFSLVVAGLMIGVAAAGYYVFGSELADYVTSKLSPESASTSVKIGHIQSVFEELRGSWLSAIFGQGVGTSFFSIGVGREVTNIEVSHFNLLRQYGVIGTFIVIGYITFVIAQVARQGSLGKAWGIGLVGMFFVAGTNPVLFSPMFFVPLLMARMFSLGSDNEGDYAR